MDLEGAKKKKKKKQDYFAKMEKGITNTKTQITKKLKLQVFWDR
jgi:hypothetical protein